LQKDPDSTMHTLVEVNTSINGGTHVPAFLAKLWKLVDDESTDDLICWSEVKNAEHSVSKLNGADENRRATRDSCCLV